MKEVIKKQLENTPNGKDDEKTQNDKINTTNVDLTFSSIKLFLKLSLKLVEFKWDKVIILRLLLMLQTYRVF